MQGVKRPTSLANDSNFMAALMLTGNQGHSLIPSLIKQINTPHSPHRSDSWLFFRDALLAGVRWMSC